MSASAYERLSANRECVNTEFDWEVKRGFEKASVSRAVRLRECPLAGELTVLGDIQGSATLSNENIHIPHSMNGYWKCYLYVSHLMRYDIIRSSYT